MKKLSLKKLSCLFLVLICAVTCITLPAIDASAKVVKPSKVAITALGRYNKSTVGLRWKKASRAKGYQVYMKTNGGGYKRILTTRGRYLKKSGLKINSSYYFKVRAYTTYKGKTYYGAFSNVRKIKMTSYVYLVDVMKPYGGGDYTYYTGAKSFMMAGKKYFRGFSMDYSWDGFNLLFNFSGKYSKISFIYGELDEDVRDSDRNLFIYQDNILTKTLKRNKYDLPKNITLDIKDTYKFELIRSESFQPAFADVKLYY